jgi:hypothetical protein
MVYKLYGSEKPEVILLQSQLGPENCTLVWEDGGHFADNDGRLARAFGWCI